MKTTVFEEALDILNANTRDGKQEKRVEKREEKDTVTVTLTRAQIAALLNLATNKASALFNEHAACRSYTDWDPASLGYYMTCVDDDMVFYEHIIGALEKAE